jgi:hypothetical protein
MFQETSDQENYQGRYVLRHPFEGDINRCEAGHEYARQLRQRQDQEAHSLADLTGWRLSDIRDHVPSVREGGESSSSPGVHDKNWWSHIWN